MEKALQDRNYLFERHHLSHQQIDRWLNENRSKEFIQEKLKRLEAVRLFLEVTDRLRENHIPFVCLKGPLLSFRIYGDPSVRLSHDIDLLIPLEKMDAALTVMMEGGYTYQEKNSWPVERIRQELLMKSCHHICLLNKQSGFYVEIHWSLTTSLPIPDNKIERLIDSNLTILSFAGRDFTVLNKELELLYLLIHGARHGWSRLKWLVDISEYPLNDFDQQRFLRLADLLKADRIIGQTNYFLRKYFEKELPFRGCKKMPALLVRYAQRSIDGKVPIDFSQRYIIQRFRYHWIMFQNLHYKIKLTNNLFIGSGDIIKYNFSYRAVYILFRPFSYLKRRILHV